MLPYILIALSTLVSEDLACIATGLLIASHMLGFAAGTAACAAGIFAGDLLLVLAGRSARFVRLRARAGFLAGNTGWKLVATRFTPGLRLPVYVAAGLSRVPIRIVVTALFAGAVVWTPILVGAANWLGGPIVVRGLKYVELAVVAAVATKLAIHYRVWSYEQRRRALAFVCRKVRWEFWPSWAAYLPLVPCILWLGIRHRSLTLFTAANPGIATGGLVGESKSSILLHLRNEPDLLARWSLLPGRLSLAERRDLLRAFLENNRVAFPVVLKPDVGERGSGVAIIRSEAQAIQYLEYAREDTIVQEYVAGPEFGVFYRRRPGDQSGEVISITAKQLPAITGDGRRTFEQLVLADPRAFCLHKAYLAVAKHPRSYIPAHGERVQLVEIGSHCRGAVFLDATGLRTPALSASIDCAACAHPGFFYGRFDLRADSVAALQQGRFKILELNGVGAEPTHVYDPAVTIWTTYRTLIEHWRQMFEIGAVNRAMGSPPDTIRELWSAARGRRALSAPEERNFASMQY